MKDIIERAGWTAVEVALGVLLASGAGWFTISAARTAALAGLAAALSVVKTYALQKARG